MTDRLEMRSWLMPAALAAICATFGILAGYEPGLAVAGALAIAFVALLLADLALGLSVFVLLTFFAVLASPDAGIVKVAGLVVALTWVAVATTKSGERVGFATANPALTSALGLFLGWAILSVTWAEDAADTKLAIQRFVLNAVLMLIVYTAVTKRRHVVWLFWAFALGGVASMVYGVVLAPVDPSGLDRVAGAGVDSNDLAIVLVAGMILAGALATTTREPLPKLTAAGISLLCGVGVLLTFSRTGLFTLALALIGGLLVASRRRGRMAVIALLVSVCAVGYVSFLAPQAARDRITTVGSGSGRTDLWTVAWRMVEDKPVRGVGAGNFPATSFNYISVPGALDTRYLISPTGELQVAHNTYLEVLAELGVIGFVIFIPILILPVVAASRAATNFMEAGDTRMETLARALLAAQVGMLGGAVFTSLEYSKQLWLLLALGPAMLALSRSTSGLDRAR